MFQVPAAITMTIAATRIYRSLVDFSSNVTDQWEVRLHRMEQIDAD